ncbi:Deoxyribonuclease-2-alpha [Trichinella britovi]|uniref:Deoxyribonuclease-2-alpha n=1 Tax=Trichinella britovi TaxID=45882 RepID=A0A0V1CJ43_TRIBR|nr:Deoxyribonuclease-2-alpha [Trichinella britovi]
MQLAGSQVSRQADSAKWALIDGKNTPPNAVSSSIIKSDANFVWAPSAQNVNLDREHSIVRTMADFIANNGDIKVLAYSDDPPNLPSRNEKSKAKGVLLVHSGADDEAAWFVHTVPKFLAHLGGYSWPAAETPKGHMFLCLSLSKAHLNSVAKAIRYQEPFIYANNLSPALLTQYNELSNLATGVEIRVTPFLEHAKFTTKAVQVAANIEAFGKHTKSYSDMYAKVLKKKLAASIRIWAPSDTRSKSICKGQYHLRKVASPMQFDGVQVRREVDSARWAVVDGKNIVCLTTNDYKATEKQIPGAAVATCKDDGGNNVDWYFVYKPPNVLSSKLLKSDGNPAWAASGANIDQNRGHSIITTMENFVQYHAQINVLAYSDDPPNLPPRNEKSKTKGVLLVRSAANEAAWFVHTVPNFLAYLNAYSWPAAETAKGHMFLCISFSSAILNSVGKAIRYQEPYIYVNNLPAEILNQHMELSNLINGIDVRVTPFLAHETFVTKGEQAVANIQAFGKHSKSFADMYARILRNKFAASIMVWSPADARSKSICRGQHKLQKITSIQFDGVQVSRGADSAKWALIDGKSTVCFTTNDYTATDKRTPGAAVCLKNAGVYNAFRTAAFNVEACNN